MKVDAALGRGAGDAEHLIFMGRRGGKGESSPPIRRPLLLGLGLGFFLSFFLYS
jgi:hypothetical protein